MRCLSLQIWNCCYWFFQYLYFCCEWLTWWCPQVFLAKSCHQFPHVINTVTNICINNNPITVCIARHSTGCLSQKSESECLVSGRVSNQGPTECKWEAFSLGLTVLVCIYCSVNCVRLMCVNSLNNNID